jgi:crotonobetainyl-CoA:carnitine CoA-transferase CaiB-like acyl-CoA transferase
MPQMPLADVKVLDLSRVLAGPLSAMVLADLGADVIKVEQPQTGDGTRDWGVEIAPHDSSYFSAFNRSKRSITLDLSAKEDQAVAFELAAEADVLVENFRAGTAETFGLGYETLKAVNPKLVYCAVAGYDRQGAEADRPGYDLVLQGETGLISINGSPDGGPLRFGLPVVDMFTGMSAAHAILGALLAARASGVGRRIDIALFDAGLVASSYFGLEALLRGGNPARYGNFHSAIVPYGVFAARDGEFVLAAGTNRQYEQLCRNVLGRPDLVEDERYATNLQRVRNRESLEPLLFAEFATRPRVEILEALKANDIPAGEVEGLFDAVTGRRAKEAGLIDDMPHPVAGTTPVMLPPWRFDGDRLPATRPPMLGEHNNQIDRSQRAGGLWEETPRYTTNLNQNRTIGP